MVIEPYLFFEGRCEEALAFYAQALGAETTMLLRYKESPEPMPANMLPPGNKDKIMHASFRVGEAVIMASDGMCSGQASFQGFSLSMSCTKQEEAEQVFAALSDGGEVRMPLGQTFFSPYFGMVTDRFGVAWMISVDK